MTRGLKVAWFTLEDLGNLIRRHRADDTMSKAIGRILRADLVVVDDIGLLPVAPDAAEGLYRLVEAAYEKRSIGISSNLHPDRSTSSCPNPGHRHRRPVAAPRPRLPNQRRQRPTHTSTRRERSHPTDLKHQTTDGHPLGRSRGHHRAEPTTVNGQIPRPPPGSSQWPLTLRPADGVRQQREWLAGACLSSGTRT